MGSVTKGMNRAILDAALGHMEEVEYASLVWGSVDGGFNRDQLAAALVPLLEEDGHSDPAKGAQELIEELIDRALVCECKTVTGEMALRSRFAEGVRLIVRLRQLFPKRDWRMGPQLVSDYRVDLRPRRYPRRDQCPRSTREAIAQKKAFSRIMTSVWDRLAPPDGQFMLSGFQARAAESILVGENRGTIVTTGTGSGKTLAFYLPALTRIAASVRPGNSWTKCLSVYPRVELLKDQFSESLGMCARIRKTLVEQGSRPLTIGTLFGDTPERAQWVEGKWPKAAKQAGVVCPYSRCPEPNCEGDLVWPDDDWKQGRERLVCQDCGHAIEEDSIILTRERAKRTPPDILFTTMEMLHKRLADVEYGRLLGVGVAPQQSLPLVLLDEVHTYTGLSGAQGAMVIRRWKHAAGANPVFVGLSATLLEAKQFFHELTGVDDYRVEAVGALDHEMVEEGAEYQLVLKGNPASQTSLLSTTIQSCMLLARLLDPPAYEFGDQGISGGRYGVRAFAFTDDLDVNTRLYDDLRDAEGFKVYGPRTAPLADLRGIRADDAHPEARELDGQRWHLPEQIGHRLDQPLEVGRTSSRDPGVERRQNLIVATASLEVGYNDSEVGAVLQHKAPMNFAAFLQRKGRAGRKRTMRPWTVTVLTAFGRDMLAFQGYHQLFEPTLERQHLPIRNLYLVRMQALSACLDWLSLQWKQNGNGRGWFWRTLSTPDRARQGAALCYFVLARLNELLEGVPAALQSLATYIKGALDLSDDEVQSVLYAPPRSILLEALPTLHRRLTTMWATINGKRGTNPGLDLNMEDLPLPEFIAPNLFSDLMLPEVVINIEGRPREERMSVDRSLREVVPGRVTRRFAEHNASISHWVCLDDNALLRAHQTNRGRKLALDYPLASYVSCTPLDRFPLPGGQEIMVYAPVSMQLKVKRTRRVSNMSNAFPIWHSHLFATDTPLRYAPAQRSKWRRVVSSIDCHIHAHRSSVTVRRYAVGAEASLRIGKERVAARFSFVDDENAPAGLGMEFEADGIAMRYRLPLAEQFTAMPLSRELEASLRHAYYRDMVVNDEALRTRLNVFQLDWLQRIYLATVITWATVADISLEAAHLAIRERKDSKAMERAMSVVLGFQDPVEEGEGAPPLFQELMELMSDAEIMGRLHALGEALHSPDIVQYCRWCRERLHENMALAVHDACIRNVPRQATMSTLLVDSEPLNPDSESGVIWITENALGGSGVMEALVDKIADNPVLLFAGIEASVAPTDLEFTALILEQVVRLAATDEEIAAHVQALRTVVHHEDRGKCRKELTAALKTHGILLSKSASVALNSRLLRPGTQPEADALIVNLLDHWDQLEARFGIAIGLQQFCVLVALDPVFRDRIRDIVPKEAQQNDRDIAAQLYGILWPRQHEARQQSDIYHPFKESSVLNEPRLVREILLKGTYTDVHLSDPNWFKLVHQALSRSENCRLIALREGRAELARAVAELLLAPVDIDYLQFYPTVERYEQGVSHHAAIITIWEDM